MPFLRGPRPTPARPARTAGGLSILEIFSSAGAGAQTAPPLTEEMAAVMIQRSFRGMVARKEVNQTSRRSAITGLAKQLASGVGTVVGRIVDNVILAPVNMASESLIHAALGKLLAVLVKGYDKRHTLRMTSAGIVIGGKAGLHLDDEALAALLGGMSAYTDVWLSSITIKLPVVLTVWPVEVSVAKVTFTMPPVALVLSPGRMAELSSAINGDKPKEPVKRAPTRLRSTADLDARILAAKYGGVPHADASPIARSATRGRARDGEDGGEEEGGEGEGGYGQFERAIDGVVVSFGLVEITMTAFDALAPPNPAAAALAGGAADGGAAGTGLAAAKAAAQTAALRRAAERRHADVRLLSVGCLVCGVRAPSTRRGGPLAWMARQLARLRGRAADAADHGGLAPLPAGATIFRLEQLRLANCTAEFIEAPRLVATTHHPAGGGRGVLGAVGSGIGSLFGRGHHAPSAHANQPRGAEGAELLIHKRLSTRAFSAMSTNAHGMHVPLLQGFELAVHVRMRRAKRSGKLVSLELDLVFPHEPIGWLVDAAQRTHGHLRVRTERTPAHPSARDDTGAAAARGGGGALNALLGAFPAGGPSSADAQAAAAAAADELAMWRRGADRSLNIAASFDALDLHIRACLERPVSHATRRELVRAREKVGLGKAAAETAGDFLWTSPEHQTRLQLPTAEFRALLSRHEVLLSDETFKMLLGKLDAHLSAQVDLHRFLTTYMPDRAASGVGAGGAST